MDENPIADKKSLSPVVVFATFSVLAALLIVVWAHQSGVLGGGMHEATLAAIVTDSTPTPTPTLILPPPSHQPVTREQLVPVVPPLPTNLPPPNPAFASMIAQSVAELGVKPKTVVLPNELALQEVAAIKRADYAAASRIAGDVLARSKLDAGNLSPFNAFMGSLTHGNDPVLLNHLNEWVQQQPQSVLAYLMRADYYFDTGWNLRGTDVGSRIPTEIYAMFVENEQLATADLRKAIDLNPRIPWSYFKLLCAVSGEGDSDEVQDVFEMAIKAYPGYYSLYKQRLYTLTPKWGGSLDEMYAFAARYAGKAADSSPLKFLYLEVYDNVLNAAWFECRSMKGDAVRRCVDDTLKSQGPPKEVGDGIIKALNLYKVSDPIRFSQAIWPVLSSIAASPGSSATGFGEMVQTAATIMGSDTRLTHAPGHNSYVLDDVTGQVWAQQSYLENADQKYRDALADIEQTTFHDEAERDEAETTVLIHLMNLYLNQSQWVNTIVFYNAAESVGGVNFSKESHQKCMAYLKLKHYSESVTECTRVLQANNYYDAPQYYLGRSYEGLQQWDAALAVYAPIALGADLYRDSSAIWMSVDYGKKNDMAGELKSLNEHGYLFDTETREPDDLAVAFNNRCHALMELGRLDEALADCNVSLKYGQLPDAIHKQQELLRRLTQRRKSI